MPEIVSGNPVNKATSKKIRNRSSFDLSYGVLDTQQFGYISPDMVMETVPNDKDIKYRPGHDLRTYTLKAPLMNDIVKKRDAFFVDYRAICPMHWDKIYTNPSIGDDIDASKAGPNMITFGANIQFILNALSRSLSSYRNDASTTAAVYATWFFRHLLVSEYFFSSGSLMSKLGYRIHKAWRVRKTSDINQYDAYLDFDTFFDLVVSQFFQEAFTNNDFILFTCNGQGYGIVPSVNRVTPSIGYIWVSPRQALDIMRENMDFVFTTLSGDLADFSFDFDYWANTTYPGSGFLYTGDYSLGSELNTRSISIAALYAYQIICAHYFTNDKVDYVYSAELYRELLGNYFMSTYPSANRPTFTLNGLKYEYDWTSGEVFHMMSNFEPSIATDESLISWLAYLRAIFGFNRSLRFVDYFTGSRTSPLAVGDVDVAVNNNLVSVIDVTKNIQRQRFLNAVNRIPRSFKQYVEELTGGDVKHDAHDPLWLAQTEDIVYGQEVQNTGEAQMTDKNSVTTIMRSSSNKYAFEIDIDTPGIIMSLTYYDVRRVYPNGVDRCWSHIDRYDFFNPFMQYIGDQPIYRWELDIPTSFNLLSNNYFGYTLRHMEYKQRFSTAVGGFVCDSGLKGYAFIGLGSSVPAPTLDLVQDPDFIRSWPSEMDEFYESVGYSLGTGFHFIVKQVNNISAKRPMAYAPSIL